MCDESYYEGKLGHYTCMYNVAMSKNISGGARQAKQSLDSAVSSLLVLMYSFLYSV